MKKNTDTIDELETDDEALRERGLTDGPVQVAKITLRPITPTSFSQIMRRGIFNDDKGDPLQRTAGYVFLHSEPKDKIQAVVNNELLFWTAVDDWLDENLEHHLDMAPYSDAMSEGISIYLAAKSEAKHPSSGGNSLGK